MNKQQGERLIKLAEFLETIPRQHFDMDDWGYGDFKQLECGSAACAMGWATTVFPRSLAFCPGNSVRMSSIVHKASGLKDLKAAMVFFGLDKNVAEYLFLDRDDHQTPKQVVRTIRRKVHSIQKARESA